jgi:hypothetical protein
MPDIAMCRNNGCPSCLRCRRFTALPNEDGQWYAGFAPPAGASQCDDYLPAPRRIEEPMSC